MSTIDGNVMKEIEKWAAEHPNPDEPLLAAGRKSYSPREILHEVREGTDLGKKLLENYKGAYLECFLSGLDAEELIRELEFIISRCFLTGIRGGLSAALNGLELYLNPPNESFNEYLRENNFPVKSSEDYRKQAEEGIQKAVDAYETIPFDEMSEDNPLHRPFFEGREVVRNWQKYCRDIIYSSGDKALLDEQVPKIRDVGHAIDERISILKRLIKEKTGKDYRFMPNCYLSPDRANEQII